MKTEISTDRDAAVELLRNGEVVALPTETVYGLAADALKSPAVVKIFEAKERPRFDPLIVHLPNRDWLDKIVDLPAQDRQSILELADAFWPGPFTMVLPKREIIPDIVTAGLDTVAVRISAHPVFSQIIREFDSPLAAPSANRFGNISPTTAQHVFDELSERIPLIIDGGATEHGIESTIVAVRDGKIDILRRGPITDEQLSIFGKVEVATPKEISAPGQLPSHYAPQKPLQLVDNAATFSGERAGLLAWNAVESPKFVAIRRLSERQDLREAAANLFRYLRELDANEDVDLIVAERVPDQGLGAAIMDRLRRAAHRSDAPDMPR
ncbi:MAG: L-threonylcarbamoyladenylate synthase [Spartobacteria bacterium]